MDPLPFHMNPTKLGWNATILDLAKLPRSSREVLRTVAISAGVGITLGTTAALVCAGYLYAVVSGLRRSLDRDEATVG